MTKDLKRFFTDGKVGSGKKGTFLNDNVVVVGTVGRGMSFINKAKLTHQHNIQSTRIAALKNNRNK